MPPGFKFEPTDQVLIVEFLLPYARREIVSQHHVVQEEVYGKDPRDLLCDGDVGYYFTTRTKCGGRVKRTYDACGTWTVKEGKREIKSADGKTIIGYKTMLSYCSEEKRSLGYTMYEYELPPPNTNNGMQDVRIYLLSFLFLSFSVFCSFALIGFE